jgi:MFS transporter, PAT family, beta-lactamase induction signal transducer AmpG
MNLLEKPAGRSILFTMLYASEGAPIGFIWWALPALWRERGGAVGEITTVLAVVTSMWAVKFLWAPVVDTLRTPRWGFRSWIVTAQVLMGLTLLPMLWFDPLTNVRLLTALLVVHAFCATTQDVSIDALAINCVPREELGTINGGMSAGKFVGRGLFGGVALIVFKHVSWGWIVLSMIGVIWSSLALLFLVPNNAGAPEPGQMPSGVEERFRAFAETLRAAFARRATWVALAFALIGGAAFESTGALTSPYLVDRGVPVETIGWFRTFAVMIAMIVGGLLGGVLTDRLGKVKATAIFLIGIIVTVLALALADHLVGGGPNGARVLMGILTLMYLCYGLFIAASYALFMRVTDPRLGATQFSTFMAATNGCESWSTWAGGQIVEHAGYATSFVAMSLVSALSLPLLGQMSRNSQRDRDRLLKASESCDNRRRDGGAGLD